MEGTGYYGATAPGENNSWVLCRNHKNCKKCQKTLNSWKSKCGKHAFNAQRTKFALMCFLQGRTQEHEHIITQGEPGTNQYIEHVNPVPIEDNPIFTGTMDEIAKKQKQNELYGCGICNEKCVKEGKKKPVIYNCGHTNCAECFNAWCETKHSEGENVMCPYCRKEITKAIRLFVGV
jgi:hypothetical protein